MKSSLLLVILGLTISLSTVVVVSAASGDTATGTVTTSTESPLLIDSITPIDDSHITIVFNQSLIRESVRVRVTKQSDESNIRIESFSGGSNKQTINVILSEPLDAKTSYKMTIVSAISENGILIKDGADGVKEFTTPIDLKKYAMTLNAPTNPNAVMVAATGVTSSGLTGTGTVRPTPVVKPTPAETAGELPLTGVDTRIFFAIAAILALIIVLRRRRI